MISSIINTNPVIGANIAGRKRGIEFMDAQNFILNAAFNENAKEYATRPVRAAKYQPGMQSGFMIYFANKALEEGTTLHEGMKFFDTEAEAANVKHFFTLLGKIFFTPLGREIFTLSGKQFFTWYGKEFFTRYSKQIFTLPVVRWFPCFYSAPLYGAGGQV